MGSMLERYMDLVRMMPPRAIGDDARCEETIAVIDRLMALGELTRDQADYMETLVQLVQAYESVHHPILGRGDAEPRETEPCSACGGRGYDCDIQVSCALCDGTGTQCAGCHFPLPDCDCCCAEAGPAPTRYTFFVDKALCRPSDGGIALLTTDVHIELRDREGGLWAVAVGGSCVLNADGETEYEPSPSGRSDAFLARARFPLGKAIAKARAFIGRHTEYAPRSG